MGSDTVIKILKIIVTVATAAGGVIEIIHKDKKK
jgi:hypothetical protein